MDRSQKEIGVISDRRGSCSTAFHGMVKFLLCMFFISYLPSSSCQKPDLSPKPWPEQFHAQIYQDLNGSLSIVDLWYDWPNGRNLIIIQLQLGYKMYDVEWTNGTSYFYNLEANSCRTLHFPVGILRPDWLDHSSYLGVKEIDGFSCNVWEKVDFITYYEDVETQRPVAWYFQWTGQFMHIISFEVGATLPDAFWQAPSYCFSGTTPSKSHGPTLLLNGAGPDEEPWKDSWKRLLSGTFRDT